MTLSFKTYEDYMNDKFITNVNHVKQLANEYIEHKKEGGKPYHYDGYPGVTSVEHMMDTEMSFRILDKWREGLRQEGQDPDKVTKQYADTGTLIHYDIECKISPVTIMPPEWELDEYPENAELYIGNARAMWDTLTTGKTPTLTFANVKCEQYCRNDKYKYAGYYDIYADINGKRTIADLKTSPKCQDKYLLQIGAYSMYFDKMPEQGMIINLCPDKRNKTQRPIVTTINQEQLQQAAEGWIAMITAFHDIYDDYLPIVEDNKHCVMQKTA